MMIEGPSQAFSRSLYTLECMTYLCISPSVLSIQLPPTPTQVERLPYHGSCKVCYSLFNVLYSCLLSVVGGLSLRLIARMLTSSYGSAAGMYTAALACLSHSNSLAQVYLRMHRCFNARNPSAVSRDILMRSGSPESTKPERREYDNREKELFLHSHHSLDNHPGLRASTIQPCSKHVPYLEDIDPGHQAVGKRLLLSLVSSSSLEKTHILKDDCLPPANSEDGVRQKVLGHDLVRDPLKILCYQVRQ